MKYVTPKQSKALSTLVLAALLSSCSLRSNGQSQTLTIALPGAKIAQNPILKSMNDLTNLTNLTKWMSLAWASTTTATNLNNDPSTLSDFDCFAVNVNGPGINLDPNITCSDPADAPAIFGGFVPNGNTSIDLDVPAGPDRVIKIMGVKSLIGCPSFRDMVSNGGIDFKNIGHLYEIGKTRQDIFSDATVTINATYNSASPVRAFSQCKANGDNSGSHLWGVYAGTGPGNVNASKTLNGSTYVTGKFDYIGPDTHSGAMISQSTGSLAGSNIAHINGVVNCAVTDGSGGYYVGGSITGVESTTLSNAGVIHVNADGSWDPSFVITLDAGAVKTCLRDGLHLYLGGTFGNLTYNSGTSQTATALADFNLYYKTATNLGLVATFDASPTVNSISLGSGRLYVGGNFTYSGTAHSHAVAIDVATTTLNPDWHPDPGSAVSTVYFNGALSVYLGGAFSSINTTGSLQSRYHLARVDYIYGTAETWDPSAQLSGAIGINAIVSDGLYVYAAVAGSGTQKVMRLDLVNPALGPVSIFTDSITGDSVNTLAYSTYLGSPVLYIGGKFTTTDATPRQGVTAYQDPAGSFALFSGFSANVNKGQTVNAIVPDAIGRLFVGGNFQSVGGVLRKNAAAFNLLSGTPTSWAPTGPSMAEGTSIASDGSSIFIGYKSDGTSINGGVAKYTSGASASLLYSATTTAYGDGNVYTIALSPDNSSLYVGGNFTTLVSQSSLGGLIRLNASNLTYDNTWTSTVSLPGVVNTILADANHVYVSGTFTKAGPVAGSVALHPGFVAFNTADSNIVTGWTNNTALASGVQTIAVHPSGDLLVGATQSSLAIIRRVSPIDGSTISWPNGPSDTHMAAMTDTHSLLVSGGALYMGGAANGASGRSLLAFDLINEQFVAGYDPHFYNYYAGTNAVNSLEAPVAGVLMVGGQFSQANVIDNAGTGGKEAWGIGVINANTGVFY